MGKLKLKWLQCVLSGLLMTTAFTAKAEDTLDQSVIGPTATEYSDINKMPPGEAEELIQTFTVNFAGLLTHVNLPIYEDLLYNSSNIPIGYYDSGINVHIYNTKFQIIGTVSVPNTAIPNISSLNSADIFDLSVDLSTLNIQVTSGEVYGIGVAPTVAVPATDAGNGLDWIATANTYTGGEPYVSFNGGTPGPFFANQYDLEFQTFVSTGNNIIMQGGSSIQVPVFIGTPAQFKTRANGETIIGNIGNTMTGAFYKFYWPGGNFNASAGVWGVPYTAPQETLYLELYTGSGNLVGFIAVPPDSSPVPLAPNTGGQPFPPYSPMAPGYYIIGVSVTPPNADPTFAITFQGAPGFAGTLGQANCFGTSVSVLAQQLGSLASAASALGYPSVQALQGDIQTYCGG